jgi:hypothetical protein
LIALCALAAIGSRERYQQSSLKNFSHDFSAAI